MVKLKALFFILALLMALVFTGCITSADAAQVGYIKVHTDADNERVLNVATPEDGTDGVNKDYVDQQIADNAYIEGTYWDDLRAPVNMAKLRGTADPVWSDAVGGQTLVFSPTQMKEIYFILQLPHSYIEGTDIVPHVHWLYGANTVGESCRWGLEYWWNEHDVFLGGPTTIYVNTALSNNDAVMPFITSFPAIAGTGHTISSFLNCRLFRDATDVSDNYTSNVYLFEFDIHFETNGRGSEGELSK
jgi:hypothetical protein